jgi:uncharacterized protein YlaI
MNVKEILINNIEVLDNNNQIDWARVKNAPITQITDPNHNHDTRYYTKSEIDDRINSLISSVDDLEEKINTLISGE